MRAFITLFALFALALAWIPSKDVLDANDDAELMGDSDSQFFVSSSNTQPHTDVVRGVNFEEVFIPADRKYGLRIPFQIVQRLFEKYSSMTLARFNETCAMTCEESQSCLSYHMFEASVCPPLTPMWHCFHQTHFLTPKDFEWDVEVNFAYAYNKIV